MQRITSRPSRSSLSSTIFATLVFFLASACASDNPSQQGETGGSASGGTSATGGTGGNAVREVVLVPNAEGWVDTSEAMLGVVGAWYPYGDRYGVAKCTMVGMHAPEECSTITSPDPLLPGFRNVDGEMCTTGETAVVLPCGAGVSMCSAGSPDYSNMWGAGIGLDLNAEGATDAGPGAKHPYDPDAHGVVGFSFEIDEVPAPELRVEFPMMLPNGTSTEDHPDGSPYWGAASDYPASDVKKGRNELRLTDVKPPRTNYEFDRTKILAIQFHVPAITKGTTRGAYRFCIKNLALLLK